MHQTCQLPLTFMNCSIDLDAKELERKRVLGSSGRTGGVFAGVGWGLDPVHPTHSKWRYDSASRIRENPKRQLYSSPRGPEWFVKLPEATQHPPGFTA